MAAVESAATEASDAAGGSWMGPTRRERMRAATVAEIKSHAWAQAADGGALGVSLRGIARSMGMTSSALYRYFESREQLVYELIADGYESLADTLEAAETAVPEGTDPGEHFLCVARAYRSWALEHATEYALLHGTPMCDPADNPRVKEEHWRGVNVLFRAMIQGILRGALDPGRLPAASVALRRELQQWQHHMDLLLSPEALAGCLFVWSALHGAISLELFDQLPPALPAADLFDQQMRATLALLGCPPGA